jgi:hypothetical protein
MIRWRRLMRNIPEQSPLWMTLVGVIGLMTIGPSGHRAIGLLDEQAVDGKAQSGVLRLDGAFCGVTRFVSKSAVETSALQKLHIATLRAM